MTTKRTRLSAEARREKILDAALTVFGRDGFRDGSMREVASEAGLTLPGMLHHFPSKDDLLLATLERWQDLATLEVGLNETASVVEIGRKVLERNLKNPGIMRLRVVIDAEATSESHPAHERIRERSRTVRTAFTTRIQHMIDSGDLLPGRDANAIADAFIALLDGLQLAFLLNPEVNILESYDEAAGRLLANS